MLLGAIVLLAAVIRAVWFADLGSYELRNDLQLDPAAYHAQAEAILSGEGPAPGLPYYQAPLYPYFLAALYTLGGPNFDTVRAVHMLLGLLTLVVIAGIGALTFGRPAGLIAALAGALYAPFPFYEAQVMKTSLGLFLAVAGVYALLRSRSARWALAAGFVLGLAALVRENLLLLVAGGAIALWWGARAGSGSRKRAILLLVGGAIAVAPVTIRNAIHSGEFIVVTSQGGQNFYIGNNELARGVYTALPFVRPDPRYEQADFKAEGNRRAGEALSPARLSRFWFGEALGWMQSNPQGAANLWGKKFLLFWNDLEIPDNENFYYLRDRFVSLRLIPLTFGAIAPFAILGMLISLRRFRERFPLYLGVGAALIPLVAFYIFSRYRLGAVPFLLIFAAAGGVNLWEMIRQKRVAAAALSLMVLSIGWVGANRLDPIAFNPRLDGFVPLHVNRAMLFVERGEGARAIDEYKSAAALAPENGVVRKKLAELYRKEGMHAEAEEAFAAAVRLLPSDAAVRNDLAVILLQQGRIEEAEKLLREAIRIDPSAEGARHNLERLLGERAR